MNTLAIMGIEEWRVRDNPGNSHKLDELMHNIKLALKVDDDQIVSFMVHADFTLMDVLNKPELKPVLLRLFLR